MIISIHFSVKNWDYNHKMGPLTAKRESNIQVYPLRKRGIKKAQGFCLRWFLTLKVDDIELLYYCSEDHWVIPDRKISNTALLSLLRLSHDRTKRELSIRNSAVGINQTLPDFSSYEFDLDDIKKVLEM